MKKIVKIENFRELIEVAKNNNENHIVYKYKRNIENDQKEYIQKTYKEFTNDIKYISTILLNLRLQEKKIAIIGNNRYEWCVSYLAITTGDMVVVPLDKELPENEIEVLIKRSEVSAIIFEKKHVDIIKKIANKENNKLQILICMDDEQNEGIISYKELLEQGKKLIEQGNKEYDNVKINKDKMAIMLFTSGTTNEPKAVMLSQNNICSNIIALKKYLTIYPSDTLLSFLPIHHTFECTITFLFGLYCGATVAFCDGLKYITKNLKEYKISVFVAVPLILERMYKKIQEEIHNNGKEELINKLIQVSNILLKFHIDLRKIFFKKILNQFGGYLRIVLYGAAPMNKDTILGYNNLGIETIQGYGLTETSPVISAETDKRKKPGSIGIVLENLECKIINKNEEGIGEIIVKGPSIMLGYYKNEIATKKVLKDGWLYTGDYGYIDEEGFLFITGRKNDIIVLKNGKNIYPQEIEFLINKIPYVTESIVYARQKDKTDTMLCAKIVYNKDIIKERLGEKTEEEYKNIIWNEVKEMNRQLPLFKHIKNITITTEPLMKTTTQKVKRYEELKRI